MTRRARQVVLHLCAGLTLAVPWVAVWASSFADFNESIARQVVNSPAMWLVVALQGKAGELAIWNQAHPVPWWKPLAPYMEFLIPLGIGAAVLLEVVAWRVRRAS